MTECHYLVPLIKLNAEGDWGAGAGQTQRGHSEVHRPGQVEHSTQQSSEARHQQNVLRESPGAVKYRVNTL